MKSPFLQLKAFLNASLFLSDPITLNSSGACTSVNKSDIIVSLGIRLQKVYWYEDNYLISRLKLVNKYKIYKQSIEM